MTLPTKFQNAPTRYRQFDNPMRGITVAQAVTLRESYNTGALADLQWAFMAPMTGLESCNPDYTALIERRITPLLEMDWSIKNPADIPPAQASLATAQAEAARAWVDGISNLYAAIEHLAMASFRGFAHCEIVMDGPNGTPSELAIIPQYCVVRDGLSGQWKYNPEATQRFFDGLPDDFLLDPARCLIRECARPLGGLALMLHVRAALCDADWDEFLRIYGVPGGIVTLPPNVPADKEPQYLTAAEDVAAGGHGALPNGSDYKPNAAPTGQVPFKEYLDRLTEKLVLAGTGGKLTMLAESGSGTLAGGAHSDTFASLARAEAGRVSDVIQRQLVEPHLRSMFPGQPVLAWFALSAEDTPDTAGMIAEVKGLADAGFAVDPAQVEERTGWQMAQAAPIVAATPPSQSPAVPSVPAPNRSRQKKRKPPVLPVAFSAADVPHDPALARFAQGILDAPDDIFAETLARALADFPDAVPSDDAVAAFESALAESLLTGLTARQ